MNELQKLLAGINPLEQIEEQNMSIGEPAQFAEQPVQEAVADAELSNINQEAKSPNQMTKPELVQQEVKKEADRTVAGQLEEQKVASEVKQSPIDRYLADRTELYDKSQVDLKEARKSDSQKALLANVAKALGSLGASSVQRKAGVKAGLKDFQPVKGPDTASDVLKDRNSMLNKLREDLSLLQAGKKKEPSELDNKKLALEQRKLDLQEKKIDKESKKEAPLTFREKEQIKSDMKLNQEQEKEMVKIRQANLKEKKAAESSVSDLNEQLEKVKRAKKLMAEMAKKGGISDTGPVDQFISGFGDKGQELRQAFNDLSLEKMSKLFQGMSKAVDSDAERKMFEQSQASMGNYPSVNMKVLNSMEQGIKSLQQKNKGLVNRYDKKGNEVTSDKVDVVLPDGRKGRIDADKVEAFLQKYPNAQVK